MTKLTALITALLLYMTVPVHAEWNNICPSDNSYCKDVGKMARNATGPKMMRSFDLGKIKGVVWKPRGSLISLPGFDARTSPRDSFYYIIDDGAPDPFIRQCREIKAK